MAGLIPFNRNEALIRTNHFNDFYNMLDDFFNDTWSPRNLSNDSFKIDVAENDSNYVIEAELPGVKKEDISLDMTDGKLTITVTHEENKEEKKPNYIHRERRYGSKSRSVYLSDVSADGIQAQFSDGILSVTIPKEASKSKTTRIDIQ
jgi:HSP20 family protein